MAAHQEARRRRDNKTGDGAGANWRPNAKAVAAALREIANSNHLNVAYATCVTVQSALRGQNSDEDTEIEVCLRTHVGGAILREVEELRVLAQAVKPVSEAPRR